MGLKGKPTSQSLAETIWTRNLGICLKAKPFLVLLYITTERRFQQPNSWAVDPVTAAIRLSQIVTVDNSHIVLVLFNYFTSEKYYFAKLTRSKNQ